MKHRSHEDRKDDQEEQQQWLECIKNWLECIKNSYAIAKDWMDKDEALWVESKLGLDSNGELKSNVFNKHDSSKFGGGFREDHPESLQSKKNIIHS